MLPLQNGWSELSVLVLVQSISALQPAGQLYVHLCSVLLATMLAVVHKCRRRDKHHALDDSKHVKLRLTVAAAGAQP